MIEKFKSQDFKVSVNRIQDNVINYDITIKDSILSFEDFKQKKDILYELLNSEDISEKKFKSSWVSYVDQNAMKIKDFIYENLENAAHDPKFNKLIWYLFQFSELIFHSIGSIYIIKRKWNLVFFYYQQVLRGYELIHKWINYKLEELSLPKIDFDDIKWGVPLANIALSLLNNGRFEEGLFYMLAADFNDKHFDPEFSGLAEKVIYNQIFELSMRGFYQNAKKIRDLYNLNSINLEDSLLKNDKTLRDFFKDEENIQYFLYIAVNFEKIYRWDLNFLKSDYNYSMHFLFKILINITHIIEVWFKKLLGYKGSKRLEK